MFIKINKCFFIIILNLYNFEFLIFSISSKVKFRQIEHYFKKCNIFKTKNPKKYIKFNIPKISVVSPLHNSAKFLLRFMNSVQYQTFDNIEIILIDDFSVDNTTKIIENYQKDDERIILLKNKKNKGTFFNRNIGVLVSKGKYLLTPDPDDIISKNILNICYKIAEKYKYELIRFNIYVGNSQLQLQEIVNNIQNKQIYQPELSTYLFYLEKDLKIIDISICNKFLQKKIYIECLSLLNKYYLKTFITYYEDLLLNYFFHRKAKSLLILKQIGYFYIKNNLSITNNLFGKSGLKMRYFFFYINLIFNYSKNTKSEKDMSNILLSKLNYDFNILKIISKDIINTKFYINIINNYLKSKFISLNNKIIFMILKNKIKNYQI